MARKVCMTLNDKEEAEFDVFKLTLSTVELTDAAAAKHAVLRYAAAMVVEKKIKRSPAQKKG